MDQFIDAFLLSRGTRAAFCSTCFPEDPVLPFKLSHTRLEHLHRPAVVVRFSLQFRRTLPQGSQVPDQSGDLFLNEVQTVLHCVSGLSGLPFMVRLQR